MTWYVTRNADNSLASIHRDHMAGYNDEALADDDPAIVAFLAAADVPTKPSPREWLERLSDAKQAAIAAAGAGNASILLWLLKAAGSQAIDVSLQETKDGVAALVTAGVITADDETMLLAP